MTTGSSRLIKYLLGFSMALLAISNCFNVLSNSVLVNSPLSDSSTASSTRTAELSSSPPINRGGAALHNSSPMNLIANSTSRSIALRRVGLAVPFVPNITATLADSLQVDNNNSGKADPGDTLMYTVTISNSGTDATGVMFTDDLTQNGGNLTLVAGSVNSSPVAVNDSYPNGVGNTRMTVSAANGVLVNDFDPDGTTPTAQPITNGATTNGGTVTLLADGSFTYDPPVGFTGTDTFTYTATDGSKTDTATVSITLTSRVWYVDNTYTGAISDGRSATPFKTLAPVNGASDADAPGDIIYVVENGGGAYTGGLALENNEQLIGNGVALVVNSQTLRPAGSKPTITNSGGNGVTLAQGDTVRGLIAQTTATGGASAGIAGSSVGNFTADTLQAVGNPGAAVDIQTAGTLAVTFESLSSTNGTRGVRVTSPTGGTFAVTGATTITGTTGDGVILTGGGSQTTNFTGGVSITTASGRGIVANAAGTINVGSGTINATGGAALDLTSMNLGTGLLFTSLASTNSTAEGIKMGGCIQNLTVSGTTNILTPTGIGIDIQNTFGTSVLNFGNTTVNKTSAGTGVNLVSNGTSTISFGALNITAANGSGLVATTSGTVNATSGTISATNGPGLNLSSVTSGLTLTSVSSTNSGTTGITLTTVAGSLSIGTTTITNPTGIGINATSNSASLSFGNTTANSSGGTGAVLGGSGVGNTGTITFSALNIAPDANQRGLLAQENSNTITTTSGTLTTSGAVSVEITRTTSTTPLAVSLTSVSATGGTNGIVLTRTSGSFTIIGDGTNNASGGTIQSTSSHGISLNAVQNLSLTSMKIQNIAVGSGIKGTGVVNFTFDHGTISSVGQNVSGGHDSAINFLDSVLNGENTVSGAVTLTNSTITNPATQGLGIDTFSGTISNLVIQNNSFTAALTIPSGDAVHVLLDAINSSSSNLNTGTVSGNTFNNWVNGTAINIQGSNPANTNNTTVGAAGTPIVITNNSITRTNTPVNGDVGNAIVVGINARVGVTNWTITNNGTLANPIKNYPGLGISVAYFGSVTGSTLIDSNFFDSHNTAGSSGIGVQGDQATAVTDAPNATITITNNNVKNNEGSCIRVIHRNSNGSMKVKIANNTVTAPTLTNRNGIRVDSGLSDIAGAKTNVCLNISGNTSAGSGIDKGIGVRQQSPAAVGGPYVFGIQGIPQAAPTTTDVQNFINAQNPSGGGTDILNGSTYTQCNTAPTFVDPAGSLQASSVRRSASDARDSIDTDSPLFAHHGEAQDIEHVQKVSMADVSLMAEQALQRWSAMGISPEDLARLNGVTFEVTDLPSGQIASLSGNHVLIDETAAGYGWYLDQTPADDSEFDVPVFDRERQTTEFSAAYGKMDLLTVLTRELCQVYQQGYERLPRSMRKNVRWLMEPLLLPGVRRMPLNQWNLTPPPSSGSIRTSTGESSVAQSDASAQAVGDQDLPRTTTDVERHHAEAPTGSPQYSSAARFAIYRTTTQSSNASTVRPAMIRPQDIAVMGIHEGSFNSDEMPTLRRAAMTTQKSRRNKTAAVMAPLSAGIVSVGPFNLPAGESVTIMFQATIDTPVVPPGTVQVCTRGTVTANGGITVLTTDPGPPAVSGATCTPLAQADLAVTKTDAPDPVTTGSNITYTINLINNGPDSAYNVKVTDATPANTTFVSATAPAGWAVTSSPAVGGTGNVVFQKNPAGPVANGATAQFQIVVQVDAATPGGTTITNNAVATSDTPDGTQANNTGTATTTAQSQADLALTKSDSPDPVIAGSNITYTVNFVNNGPGSATSVTVTDAVPANTTFVSAVVTTGTGWSTSSPAVGGTGNVVFSKASVLNGETAVFTIVVKVNPSTANGATITNSATAAPTSSDPNTANNTATATTTVSTQADLSVTKTDSPDPVIAGNNITYTINFTNNGPSDAQTVTVTDAVPANTTFVSATVTTGTGWSTSAPAVGGTGNVVFSKATVAAGETAVFTIVVKVGSNIPDGTTISNSATAATTTTDPTSGNNTGTATTTVQARADLAVTKSDSPDPVIAGNNLTYTINFVNNGPSDAQSVTVTDAVPANTSFVSAVVTTGVGWSLSAPAVGGTGNVVFSKATVAAGETAVFTIVVHVSSATPNGATLSNSATAGSATTDPTPANNTGTATTTVSAMADLAVTKSDSPDPVLAGSNITYTINFVNNGPSAAQSVTVTDATPANTTFVSAVVSTGSGWSTSSPAVGGTGNVVFSKATVAAGETGVFTVVVKVNSNFGSGTINNSAVAASTTTDPTAANNTATAATTVQAQADLSVSKTGSPDPVTAGTNLTYTINFVNNGPSDAATATITDAVPANTTFVSATVTTGVGWSTTSPAVGGTGNVVFSKAQVVAGETAVFTIVVHVNANTASGATITNTAVAASATTDPTAGNSTSTTTATVQTQADLAVTKSDSPDPVIAGNNLTYTINFVNNGPSDAQSVTVTDAVPADTTFVSAIVSTGTGWSVSAPAVGGTGNIVFSKATVAAGESAVFTVVVHVNSSLANGSTISNSAIAASTTTDPTPANNTATATTTVQTRADIGVTKTDSPDPVFAGANLTYTINFVNNGPSDAQTVTVTDAVPANTTFVSATVTTGTGWSTSAPAVGGTGNIVFSKSSVAAGETAVFTVVVKVNANTASGTTISNSATAASATTDPTSGNNTATTTTTVQTQADLAVTKSASPDPVVASQNVTYTISFVNNGPSNAQSVTITDAVPANTTFVSATVTTGSGWSTSAPAVGGTGNLVFSKATVAAGETAVFTIVVNVGVNTPNNTVITNSATAAANTPDPTPGNNTGTASTTVIAQADLALTKTAAPDPACVQGNVTYTINFVNNGPGPGLNTTVTDAVPANCTFVSASVMSGTGWSISAPAVGGTGNVVFSKASTAAGETAVLQVVVNVNAGVIHGTVITNTATVASSISDPKPGNNSAVATSTVDPIAPMITCPANVTASTNQSSCQQGGCAAVNFATPAATDNCPGVVVTCVPPSGSCMPTGSTTVTCTATDAAGNTASCSFSVTVFDVCIQDDSNPNTVLLFNSQTGEYKFCCGGTTYTGVGTVTVRGCLMSLTHTADRRVSALVDKAQFKASATLQSPPGTLKCSITDRDIRNSSCNCP